MVFQEGIRVIGREKGAGPNEFGYMDSLSLYLFGPIHKILLKGLLEKGEDVEGLKLCAITIEKFLQGLIDTMDLSIQSLQVLPPFLQKYDCPFFQQHQLAYDLLLPLQKYLSLLLEIQSDLALQCSNLGQLLCIYLPLSTQQQGIFNHQPLIQLLHSLFSDQWQKLLQMIEGMCPMQSCFHLFEVKGLLALYAIQEHGSYGQRGFGLAGLFFQWACLKTYGALVCVFLIGVVLSTCQTNMMSAGNIMVYLWSLYTECMC